MRPTTSIERRRRLAAAASVALGAVLFAACGSSPATTTTTSSPPSSTNAPTSTSAPSSSSSSSSPTVTSTSVAPSTSTTIAPTCGPSALKLSASEGAPAAGTAYVTFTLTNESSTPCSLEGYASISFFGAAAGGHPGTKLPISATDGGPPPSAVNLDAGGTAQFIVVYTEVPVNGQGCATVASAQVTTPKPLVALSVPLDLQPCGSSVTAYPIAAPGTEQP